MYVPSAFAQTDPDEIARFVDAHPLATLVGVLDGRIEAHQLPFMRLGGVAPAGHLVSHAARANPIWRLAESRAEVLLVYSGAAAYVSPSYYPSKAEHHQVVPTYNYATVQVRGHLSCSHDPAVKLRTVELLTNHMEAGRTAPWAVTDAPPEYIEQMLRGFVALSLEIVSVEAKWKASQNRPLADRQGVVAGLRADAEAARISEAADLVAASTDAPAIQS
jgi:transcriptional regulator